MTVAPRSYYFLEKVEKILKAELKSNYCSLYLSSADLGAYKKGFGKCPPDERDDEVQKIQTVELIVVCKNSRDALGDKGSRIRFMQHKINVAFGFDESFLQLFVERREREFVPSLRKGKWKGKGGDFSDVSEDEAEVPAPKPKAKPKPKPTSHVEPDFSTEEWKECAIRGARLWRTLPSSRSNDAIDTVLQPLRDRAMYAMRLWREYNLRKAPRPMRSRESETKRDPPWEETWGVPDQSWDGGVGVSDWGDDNFGDSWAAPDPAQSGPAARPTTSKDFVVKDFADDSDVHLNLDAGTATCAEALQCLQEVRTFGKNVSPKLVLLPSGKELHSGYRLSEIPQGETLKFMAITERR
ncbi:unnamed protein product [Durusdinium trenchii]|uniref:Ubiquitin-like domain-containing protein n=2 Tax=Durusdinium trenchii TaxID=1381693 RepID=A0ABP0L7X2_9DINO